MLWLVYCKYLILFLIVKKKKKKFLFKYILFIIFLNFLFVYISLYIRKGFYPYTTDSFLKSNESYLVFDNMTKIFSQKILALLDKFEEIPGAKGII